MLGVHCSSCKGSRHYTVQLQATEHKQLLAYLPLCPSMIAAAMMPPFRPVPAPSASKQYPGALVSIRRAALPVAPLPI
jgi:hypothetical protein